MNLRPSVLYVCALLLCVAIVFVSVVSYAWSSTLVDLNCSIQDDSFYYFVPAWNGSHGAGFTFGGQKTSGFQPLYELVLTLLSYFSSSLESLVRAAINLNGWLFALTSVCIGFALRPMARSFAPEMTHEATALSMIVAALSYLCLHTVFFSSVTGKENALAALLLAALVWAVFWNSSSERDRPVLIGALCGLLVITRIAPATLLYVGVAIVFVRGWNGKFIAAAVCVLPIAAWAVFAHSYFGHVLPMSMLVKVTAPNHLTAIQSLKSGIRYAWESWKFSVSAPSRFNVMQVPFRGGIRTPFQVAVMASAVGVALLVTFKSVLGRPQSRAILALAAFDIACVFSNVLFGAAQSGRSDDMFYSVWYLYDLPVLIAINCGFAMYWLQSKLAALHPGRTVTAVLLAVCGVYFFSDVAWYAQLRPYDASDDSKIASSLGMKKYQAVDWFHNNVKPLKSNYKVVAFSAGLVDFYLFDHVVNLDGLANDAAGEATIRSGSSFQYAKEIGPDYLIDNCDAEKVFSNLERLHYVPVPNQSGYCVEEFVQQ